MKKNTPPLNRHEELEKELQELRHQLEEANDTIEAIRTGQIDALVVQGEGGHQIYTLKSADHTYRVFIEKMTEGAVTLNKQGIILFCNSQFASMVHMPMAKIIGLPFDTFISNDTLYNYQQLFATCWKEDCKGEVMLKSDVKNTPVQLSLNTLVLEEGEALSIILTDLTLQKETQRLLRENNRQLAEANHALETSNHDLQQFASVASHDLQEPLRKIQIFSNLMMEREMNLSEEAKRYLSKIIDSSGRMKTLIIDILNYSRLSANNLPLAPTDLNALVQHLQEDFELIIQEKEAVINIGNLPVIDANKGQIRQVFQNIISNALKFSKADVQPVIKIDAKRLSERSFESPEQADGPYCLISITDNGIGFEEKYVENVFSLFERLNSKDKYEGTGIGLAIAKKIVEKHQGLITAKSKEGIGSEFCIILPVNQSYT